MSLSGFSSTYTQPPLGRAVTPALNAGAESEVGAPQQPALQSDPQQAKDSQRVQALQGQYAGSCVCASCASNGNTKADDLLKQIKAENYAHIMGHEMQHQSKAGGFGGGIVIEYDGNGVATAGHVPITMPGLSSENPEQSLKDYATIRGAALAPSDPSGADMSIASQAAASMGQAQVLMGIKKQAQSAGMTVPEYRQKMNLGRAAAGA